MSDFRLVSWRGVLMTRDTYEQLRTLSPEDRAIVLKRFAEAEAELLDDSPEGEPDA